mmetsp:Transcript_19853/g.42306  ORF Transcript_19853/g.42306 Transcript_19853/m.42306 type:complete len:214 (+) Transcript_19853:631-1272(+)
MSVAATLSTTWPTWPRKRHLSLALTVLWTTGPLVGLGVVCPRETTSIPIGQATFRSRRGASTGSGQYLMMAAPCGSTARKSWTTMDAMACAGEEAGSIFRPASTQFASMPTKLAVGLAWKCTIKVLTPTRTGGGPESRSRPTCCPPAKAISTSCRDRLRTTVLALPTPRWTLGRACCTPIVDWSTRMRRLWRSSNRGRRCWTTFRLASTPHLW